MKYVVGGTIIVLIIVLAFFFLGNPRKKLLPLNPPTQNDSGSSQTINNYSFSNPKKSAHYESNTPAHGSVLAGVPINVVIDFNFDLHETSNIEILKDGKDYGEGERVIDATTVTLRRAMQTNSPDGLYTIKYNACWPDKSCHDGNFQFAIDRTLSSQFSEKTGKKEVTIKMSEFMFKPQNVKVSKGTTVIWVNDEVTEHYVNTDPHPGHNYYRPQNSKLLKKGESFSLNFDQAGIYTYHCSAHATTMIGSLLVE